jgi:hypothetical protein
VRPLEIGQVAGSTTAESRYDVNLLMLSRDEDVNRPTNSNFKFGNQCFIGPIEFPPHQKTCLTLNRTPGESPSKRLPKESTPHVSAPSLALSK